VVPQQKYNSLRILELLIETATDESVLQSLGAKLANYCQSKGVPKKDKIKLGAIHKFLKVNSKDPDMGNLLSNTIISFGTLEDKMSEFFPGPETSEIIIDINLWKDADYSGIEDYFIHELRHALDNVKFKGKDTPEYYQEKGKYFRPKFDGEHEYWSTPIEINARLSQVLSAVSKNIASNPDIKDVKSVRPYLDSELNRQGITQYFPKKFQDPEYKRIYNRALQHIHHVMNFNK